MRLLESGAEEVTSKIIDVKKPTQVGNFIGGRDGNRTCDTRIFNPLLYRLSYPAVLLNAFAYM